MLRYLHDIATTSLRMIGAIPRPLLVVAYCSTFVFWLALVASTVQLWQQRQVAIEQRRQQVARAFSGDPDALSTSGSLQTVVGNSALSDDADADVPVHPKTGRMVAAWLPTSFDAAQARASFEANKDVLDEVSPFWYTVHNDGSLEIERGARDRELVRAAQDANILVIPTIHNVNNPGAAATVIKDPLLRAAHVDAILDEVRTYDYDGIDIDYETLSASMRQDFSAFMGDLAQALHAEGKLLTVAVHAKDADVAGLGAFQDWRHLGEICDRVRIMTYDYHWRGSGPGPIAPLHWVESVARYARSVMPAEKIELGIPFYGYNWGQGSEATPQTWNEINALIEQYRPNVQVAARDQSGPVEESWFTYSTRGQTRTVWFNDRRSIEAKLQLVEQYDLAGIAIWRLGSEDPANWNMLRDQLSDHPLVTQRRFNRQMPVH